MNRFFVLTALALSALATAGCAEHINDPDPNFAPGAYEPETAAASVETTNPPAAQPQPAGTIGTSQDGEVVDSTGDVAIGADGSTYADTDPSAIQDFREPLAPYGQWVDDPTYGTYWSPDAGVVGNDFVPYETAGHWVYDDDYVWVSDYSWGYIPFHYGRWAMMHDRWGWIPGRTYSGAWVSWRTGPYGYGYIGWEPMAPAWYWWGGSAVAWGWGYYPHYGYCGTEHLFSPGLAGHVVSGPRATAMEAGTRPYVGASPSVGRTTANPSVGRTTADPTVAGNGGVRTNAQPNVGPNPHSLGLSDGQIAHSTGREAGLSRAQALASPSSATRFGAHAPMGSSVGQASHSMAMNNSGSRITETRTLGQNSAGAHENLPSSLRATASAPRYTSSTAGGASRPYYASSPHPQSYYPRTGSTTLSSRGAYSPSYSTHVPSGSSYSRSGSGEYHSPSGMSSAFHGSTPSTTYHPSSTFTGGGSSFGHTSSGHSSGGHSGGGGHGGGHR